MSVVRVLSLRCDGCGAEVTGGDPRYGVRALRRLARSKGWSTAQGALGGAGRDVCPACLLATMTSREANRVARRVAAGG